MPHREQQPEHPVATIAARVKELRGRRGWSATRLGEELNKYGVSWDRYVVNSLENGKRQNVTVGELYGLALALDVAPVHLLVPIDRRPYRIAENRVADADTARAWVTGRAPLPGVDEDNYRREAPINDFSQQSEDRVRSLESSIVRHLARSQGASAVDLLRAVADALEIDKMAKEIDKAKGE